MFLPAGVFSATFRSGSVFCKSSMYRVSSSGNAGALFDSGAARTAMIVVASAMSLSLEFFPSM